MKKTFSIAALLLALILLNACIGSHENSEESNNRLEETDMREYKPAEFSSVASFFSGFDERDIENFHYADITNRESYAPGPTVIEIAGFFEIIEEKWNSYMEGLGYTWREIAYSDIPHIPGISDAQSITWLRSSAWTDAHRGEGIGGSLYICTERRLVWFTLGRG